MDHVDDQRQRRAVDIVDKLGVDQLVQCRLRVLSGVADRVNQRGDDRLDLRVADHFTKLLQRGVGGFSHFLVGVIQYPHNLGDNQQQRRQQLRRVQVGHVPQKLHQPLFRSPGDLVQVANRHRDELLDPKRSSILHDLASGVVGSFSHLGQHITQLFEQHGKHFRNDVGLEELTERVRKTLKCKRHRLPAFGQLLIVTGIEQLANNVELRQCLDAVAVDETGHPVRQTPANRHQLGGIE